MSNLVTLQCFSNYLAWFDHRHVWFDTSEKPWSNETLGAGDERYFISPVFDGRCFKKSVMITSNDDIAGNGRS